MNRISSYILVILLLLTMCTCQEKEQLRIGISQCSQDDWRARMNDEIEREIMLHPDVTVEIRSADDSNEKQIADINYFRSSGFDIIIAAPNEAEAITPIIKEVYESGLPVIVFDRKINGEYYTAYQGVDNYSIGRSAAHYGRHLVGEGGKVIEIYGLKGSTPAIERHDGFMSGAKEEGLTVLASAFGNWNYDDAAIVADSLFDIYKDVEMVYAHNDRMAIAASNMARRRSMDIKVVGIDAAPEIGVKAVSEGVIDATFLYPSEGYQLIRTALAILKEEPFQREVILPSTSPVDKTNADILLLQNESLKEETAKIKVLKAQVDDYWTQHSAQTSLIYAVILILVLLVGVIFLLFRAFWQHQRHQRQLLLQNKLLEEQRDKQKALNEQINEATQSKLVFFTNVSHDLRTPLTLIAEPVEQLCKADNLTGQQGLLMRIANKNVRILRRMINQILDFRKYESGKLALALTEVSFDSLVDDWVEAFLALARKKDIKLIVENQLPENFHIAIDVDKIERVFFNLMSNAFKNTPANGSIILLVKTEEDRLVLSIEDTGVGIAREELDSIFERFYQADSVHSTGSGIGLSLTKAFVEIHEGTISVSSELDKGTKFTVALPIKHTAEKYDSCHLKTSSDNDVTLEIGDIDFNGQLSESGKPLLLVIDDNEDMLKLIGTLLGDDYSMIFASNGQAGVRAAVKYTPDLVICDVMMPVMDGLECCRLIKGEMSTSHIPVLLLTACSLDEQRALGYESGADGYVSKPFSVEVLRSRCKSLIDNRKRITELWYKSWNPAARKLSIETNEGIATRPRTDVDDEFYLRFLDIVAEEMGDVDLNVSELASRMGLGRSQFYRKIKALTNYSPVELLRNLRLQRSRELLTSTQKNISEVAYEVGFSSPAYFTRCYKELFEETPSELRNRLGIK